MAFLGLGCALLLLLDGGTIARTNTLALPRCLCGFAVGVLVMHHREALPFPRSVLAATTIEVLCLVAVVAFVANVPDPWRIACPALFGIAVWIFSYERGLLSRILLTRPFRLLGRLSYSIYMVHTLAILCLVNAAQALSPMLDRAILAKCSAAPWQDCFISEPHITAGVTISFLAVLLAGASVAFGLIERPWRNWSRAWVRSRTGHRTERGAVKGMAG